MSKSDISAVIPQWKPGRLLNQKVALLTSQKNPEDELFRISFKFYNDNECEIQSLYKHRGKEALQDIRKIGKCYDFKSLHDIGIDIDPVTSSGDYKRFFAGLPQDVPMREHKIQASARIFYFINLPLKEFNIVAITDAHPEVNKRGKR